MFPLKFKYGLFSERAQQYFSILNHSKKKNAVLIEQSAGPPEPGQEALGVPKVKRNWLRSACGRISRRKGKEMGNGERRAGRRRLEQDREKTERGGGWGVGGGSVFVHCVKCDHVLEPLRQLGKFPCPWLPAGNTLKRHQG